MTPPVVLPGHGALLPDGVHVPQEALNAAVDGLVALCRYLDTLPADTRTGMRLEELLAGLGGAG